MGNTPQGTIVISLDFELFWGMHDVTTRGAYGENILGERVAIPRMLELFTRYDIHATWATVGMLACVDREALVCALPESRPHYRDPRLSSYDHIDSGAVGMHEEDDPYHFGASLLRMIRRAPHQEIGCHTFSHYYCLEEGADVESFRADVRAWRDAVPGGTRAESMVFPRNQVNEVFLAIATEEGIRVYRGVQEHPHYAAVSTAQQYRVLSRVVRLLDSYLPLTGHHTYALPHTPAPAPPLLNIPASRFLRPYTPLLAPFDRWKVKRIKDGLSYAAEHGEVFHLWWHPHNFGRYTDKNCAMLEEILAHVAHLRETAGMRSRGMGELYHELYG